LQCGLTAIAQKQSIYEQKYFIASNIATSSPSTTTDRNTAWIDLKKLVVSLYNDYIINNDAISDADKKAMHVHTLEGNNTTPYDAPAYAPIASLIGEEPSSLHLIYSDPSAPGTHYKPAGVAFCELVYQLGSIPATASDCHDRTYVSRSHAGIVFENEQRGKMLYAFARWVNKNGKYGPWSGMISALIP